MMVKCKEQYLLSSGSDTASEICIDYLICLAVVPCEAGTCFFKIARHLITLLMFEPEILSTLP